jgi:hypothetical protein
MSTQSNFNQHCNILQITLQQAFDLYGDEGVEQIQKALNKHEPKKIVDLHPKPIFKELGDYYISAAGNNYVALFFKGPEDFIQRTINFCYNYGVLTTGKVNIFHNGFHYVLAPEEELRKAFYDCFKGEVIKNQKADIDYKINVDSEGEFIDITWDQDKVDSIADIMVEDFWENRIIYSNMLSYGSDFSDSSYSIGTIGEWRPDPITE